MNHLMNSVFEHYTWVQKVTYICSVPHTKYIDTGEISRFPSERNTGISASEMKKIISSAV